MIAAEPVEMAAAALHPHVVCEGWFVVRFSREVLVRRVEVEPSFVGFKCCSVEQAARVKRILETGAA